MCLVEYIGEAIGNDDGTVCRGLQAFGPGSIPRQGITIQKGSTSAPQTGSSHHPHQALTLNKAPQNAVPPEAIHYLAIHVGLSVDT